MPRAPRIEFAGDTILRNVESWNLEGWTMDGKRPLAANDGINSWNKKTGTDTNGEGVMPNVLEQVERIAAQTLRLLGGEIIVQPAVPAVIAPLPPDRMDERAIKIGKI